MATQPKPYLTPEQYLEIERAAETKSEYLNGQMFAMAGGSLNHARIVRNATLALGNQLVDGRCEVFGSDIRLRISPEGLYTYPDAWVVCGEPKFADDQKDTLVDPIVIIEVLSPSTENYDRGLKFLQYRQLASLKDYLIIAQDRVYVEHHTPGDLRSRWMMDEISDEDVIIDLPSIACTLSVADAYKRVNFARR
jgi:Uma2 family endonuclease